MLIFFLLIQVSIWK